MNEQWKSHKKQLKTEGVTSSLSDLTTEMITDQSEDMDQLIMEKMNQIRQLLDEIDIILKAKLLQEVPLLGTKLPVMNFSQTEPETSVSSTRPSAPPRKWYVVFKGRIPGVYNTWPEAQEQVSGFKGNLHQAFENEQEAYAIFHQYSSTNQG
ncbi:hypothetical protein [Viola yellow mottle virus]|uniref:Ribonuclease H n=1 Tax=Viola yellow mottle virus TaxID=2922803 RepID=A0A976QXZ2_9VIRU|nr:hypothetical protein [Viola yellow mottle virus]